MGTQTILGHDRVASPYEDQKKMCNHTGVDINAGRDGDGSGEGDTSDGAGVGDAGETAKEEGGDGAAMTMNVDDGVDAAVEKIGDDAVAAVDDDDSGEWDMEDGVRKDRNLCGKNWRAVEIESSEEGGERGWREREKRNKLREQAETWKAADRARADGCGDTGRYPLGRPLECTLRGW